jgi:tRNA modification GTPase
MNQDIIGAISTPPGEGGIAIVRISGEGAIEKINEVFYPKAKGKELIYQKPFTLTLGYIRDEGQGMVDEVLVSLMKSPRSYTGEDMVEINCHGGALAAKRCLERVLSLGIRLAQPGEFTQRAFLNGKIDAVQAEAVIDIIRAKTDRGLKLALKQLEGKNSQYIKSMEDNILEANMLLEASLDFSEDVGDLDYELVRELLQMSRDGIDKMLKAGELGDIYKEGISVAICGKPNVGKSSLLNALLGKERAIVTDVPGTTRDLIEEYVNIRGIPVRIIDTAGIRDTSDLVEKLGINRAKQAIKDADLIILVLDVEAGMTEEDIRIFQELENKERIILLVNKDDLLEKKIKKEDIELHFSGIDVIWASIKEDIGIQSLAEMIERKVMAGLADGEQLEFTVSLRQKELLKEAGQYIQEVLEALELVPLDCLGVDMQNALSSLGQLTGKDLKEESIDRIFREFCIGK